MKYASSGYTRIMKTVTVWVMALFLFAPITTIITPKTNTIPAGIEVAPNTAHAQNVSDCKVVNAIFNPSNTGWKGDKLSDGFYQGRQKDDPNQFLSTQKPVIIQVETENCSGQTLTLQIHATNGVGGANSDVDIENGGGNGITQNYVNFTIPTDKKTAEIEFLPGEEGCAQTAGQNDCQLFLRVFNSAKAGVFIFHTDDIKDGKGSRDNQRGELAYECNHDGNDNPLTYYCGGKWRLTKPVQYTNNNVDILYYYKYTNSNIYYIAENSPDVASCKTYVDNLATNNPGKSIDTIVGAGHSCINNPPATDISDKDSTIDQGKSIGTAELPPCGFTNWTIVGCVGVFLRSVVWSAVAWFAALIGQLFDLVFMYSISSAPYQNPFIEYAWTFVRDICNASFIFILLYIAIMTVFNNTKKVDYRQVIPKIILVALIVNFSLFFGRVIIDLGNASARLLYRSDVVSIKKDDGSYGSISGALIDSFDPQNLIINGAENFNKVTGLDGGGVDSVGFIVITIMSILMLFMFMKVLLEITFIFIGRIVGLWMQLILAPIAFVAEALPFKVSNFYGTGSDSKASWFSATLNQSIQATVFTFFLYLTLLFASTGIVMLKGVDGATSGVGFFLAMILPYMVIMALLKTAKDYTASMATAIAKQATAVVQSVVGTVSGIALGAAGGAGVALLGKAGVAMSKSEWAQNLMSKKGSGSGVLGAGNNFLTRFGNKQINNIGAKIGSGVLSTGEKMSKGSFDARAGGAIAGFLKGGGIDINANKNLQQGLGSYIGTNTKTGGFVQNEKNKEEKLQKEFDALVSRKTDKEYQQEYDLKAQRARILQEDKYMKAKKEAAKVAGTTFDEKATRDEWEKTDKKKWQEEYEKNNPKPGKDAAQKATQQRQATYVQTMRDNQIRQNQDRVVGGLVGATTGLLTGNLVGAYSAAAGAVAGGVAGSVNSNGVEAKFLLKYEKDRADALKKVPTIERDIQNIDAEVSRTEKEIERLGEKTADGLKKAMNLDVMGASVKASLVGAKALKEVTGELNKYLESDTVGKTIDKKDADAVLAHLKSEIEGADTVKAEKAKKALKSWYISAQENMVSEMEKHYDKIEDLKDERSRAEAFEPAGKKSAAYIAANKEITALQKEIKTFEKTNSVYSTQDEKSRKIEGLKDRKKKKEEDQKEIKTKYNL